MLFFPVSLFANIDHQADLKRRLPLYEQLISNKLEVLNNCRNTCIAHCRTANGGSAANCGPAACDVNECSAQFEEYRAARRTLDTTKQELAEMEGERQVNNPPPQQNNPPESALYGGYKDFNSEGKSTVDKLREKEKKLKKYAIAGGIATVALGLHARKCCFGPLGGGVPSPGATEAVDDQSRLDFLNFMPYSLSPHLLSFPLFSLVYSPQCQAKSGGLIACPGPYPQAPQCPIFTALATAAAVQTANIIHKRKKIKNTRRQLEVKPKPCQYDQESAACFCALYPFISGCNGEGEANIPPECETNPYSDTCGRAICEINPNSEGCISPAFHPSCAANPEQCVQLSEVLNTCEGDSCQEQILEIFKPPEGWPGGASIAGLTPEMQREIRDLVASRVGSDPTGSFSGPGGQEPSSGGSPTQEDLSRQMNDVLDGVYGGGDPTATLGGGFGGNFGGGMNDNEPSQSELTQQMDDIVDKTFGEGNSSAALAGGFGEWDSLPVHRAEASPLTKQMQKMLASMRGKKGDKSALSLRNTPLRMGEGYVGTKDDNIFFMAHSRHQDLSDRGYFIR